nr:UDP-glucuronosyltransferase 2B20-like isoform X2 [Vanessa tameamea]
MSKFFKVIVSLIYVIADIETAKILGVFPVPSKSHQDVFRPIMLELARRGHEVTMITTNPAFAKGQTPQSFTEINVHDVSYERWRVFFADKGNEKDRSQLCYYISELLLDLFVVQLKSPEIQNLIHSDDKFDLIFVESCVRPALIFSYIYKAPVIEFSSLGGVLSAFETKGAATHPLIYPIAMHRRIYNLTLWEKITELSIHYMNEHTFTKYVETENKVLKSILGSDMPDLTYLRQNVQMMYLNVHPMWDFNQPVPPNVLYLRGLHQKPQHELPEDLKSYLDSSKNGVIYVSFGTNVKPSMFPPETLEIFTDVFSQLAYDVLWKWDNDELPGRPKNVRISKWLPQSDLLRHPKIKLFITQGGLQSTDEALTAVRLALTAGVPLIGVPMLGDQWFNAELYVKHNIGIKLNIEILTEAELKEAIETIITNNSFRENVVKLRNTMRDQPLSPLDRAVWWTEHVLRHKGAAHLHSPAAHMHWTQYYAMDLVLFILGAFLILLLIFIFVIVKCECAKILAVFPTPSISHQVVFRPLVQELARRGHDVTVITTDPVFPKGQSPQNITEIDVHDISYNIWTTFLQADKGKEENAHTQITSLFKLLARVFEEQMKTNEVQKLINDKKNKFDLLFIESSVRPALGFTYLYKVPVIEISSLGPIYETFDKSGAATNPLLYPMAIRQRLNNLTLLEKIQELYTIFKGEYAYAQLVESEDKMLQKIFGSNIPSVRELKKNVHMLFLNVHPIWDFNRPVPPNVVYLGGLHQNAAKELPQDLKSYLDSSKNGVIYMSFGTNVKPSLLPKEKIQIFTNVFSELPYDVLWKWDKDEIPGRSKNVRISKWFPQSDLLKHPKVKLFITQGGLQSTDEALTAGVPLIGVPMLGDQWFNTEQYVTHNIGIKLSIETLTEEKLKDAIEAIITNYSFRQNVVRLSNIMRDQPLSPLERAVWWTEHVLRHKGATHLYSPAAHMHWTEYYAIDLILLLLGSFVILMLIFTFAIRIVLSKLKYIRIKSKIN